MNLFLQKPHHFFYLFLFFIKQMPQLSKYNFRRHIFCWQLILPAIKQCLKVSVHHNISWFFKHFLHTLSSPLLNWQRGFQNPLATRSWPSDIFKWVLRSSAPDTGALRIFSPEFWPTSTFSPTFRPFFDFFSVRAVPFVQYSLFTSAILLIPAVSFAVGFL